MAGVCIYCGAAALITGPSGVCPQCRATLPVKKVKLGKFTGKGVKAPAFLMGAGATPVVETKKAATAAVAVAGAEAPAVALSPAALRSRTEADPLAAYNAPASPPAAQEAAPPDQAAPPAPPEAPPQPQEPAAAQETPAPEEAPPVPPPTPAQTCASAPQTAAPVQEALASYAEATPQPHHAPPPATEEEDPMAGYGPAATAPPPPTVAPATEDPMAGFAPATEDPMADFSSPHHHDDPMSDFNLPPTGGGEALGVAATGFASGTVAASGDFPEEPPPLQTEDLPSPGQPPQTAPNTHDPMAWYRDYWQAHQIPADTPPEAQPPADLPSPDAPTGGFETPPADTLPHEEPTPFIPQEQTGPAEPAEAEIPLPEPEPPPPAAEADTQASAGPLGGLAGAATLVAAQESAPTGSGLRGLGALEETAWLPSSLYDPMEHYRAYWEHHQGGGAAAQPLAETPQEAFADPAAVETFAPEQSPAGEHPPRPEAIPEPAIAPTEIQETRATPPLPQEPLPSPETHWTGEPTPAQEKQAEPAAAPQSPPPPATPPAAWVEHHASEQADATPTASPAINIEEPTGQQEPGTPTKAANLPRDLLALGAGLLAAGGIGGFLAGGWTGGAAGAVAGGLLASLTGRGGSPWRGAPVGLWAACCALLATLAQGKGAAVLLPLPLPPPLAGWLSVLLWGVLACPALAVAMGLLPMAKAPVAAARIKGPPLVVGLLALVLSLPLGLLPLAGVLRQTLSAQSPPDRVAAVCQGRLSLQSLKFWGGGAKVPLGALWQTSQSPQGEALVVSALAAGPGAAATTAFSCAFACGGQPLACQWGGITPGGATPPTASLATPPPTPAPAASPAPELSTDHGVSPSATATPATSPMNTLLNPPDLPAEQWPPLGECAPVLSAFGQNTTLAGLGCDKISVGQRRWLTSYARALCPTVVLTPQNSGCALVARARNTRGVTCQLTAVPGKPLQKVCPP